MTYGEVASALRDSLAELLTHARPYYEIGGKHHTRDAPLDGFRERADLIQRYRAIVLQYAVELARTHSSVALHDATIVARWLHWIERSIPPRNELPGGRLANAVELGTEQDNVIVELWRQAAVAAFLGREREFAPMREQITGEQKAVVLKDVADIMRALIRLDDRHGRLPGWHGLSGTKGARSDRPSRAASGESARGLGATTKYFNDWIAPQLTPAGFTVDRIGYRPEPRLDAAGGTIDGAISALENLSAVINEDFPRALALRVLFRSQWKLSMLASRHALAVGDTKTAAALTVRGKIYADLIGAMRNVSGRRGAGLYTVAYGAVSTDQVARTTSMTRDQAAGLVDALDVLDARIARATRKGMSTGSYLVATGEVALVRGGPGGVRQRQTVFRFMTPRTTPGFDRLLSALEPQRRPTPPEPDANTQRDDFAAMLGHSPKEAFVRSAERATSRRVAGKSVVPER